MLLLIPQPVSPWPRSSATATPGGTREKYMSSLASSTLVRGGGAQMGHTVLSLKTPSWAYRPAGTGLGQACVPLVDNPRVGAGDLSCGRPDWSAGRAETGRLCEGAGSTPDHSRLPVRLRAAVLHTPETIQLDRG
jgi:hypothetical protein